MDNHMNIRKMTYRDIDAVEIIEKESFSIPWSENAFKESLSQPYAMFYVAEYNGEMAGYVGMYKVFNQGDITNIAVLEKYRGKGIGTALLNELFKEAEKSGIKDITLEVRKSNTIARNLYEKLDFKEIGTRKNFYEKPVEDAIVMWRKDNE